MATSDPPSRISAQSPQQRPATLRAWSLQRELQDGTACRSSLRSKATSRGYGQKRPAFQEVDSSVCGNVERRPITCQNRRAIRVYSLRVGNVEIRASPPRNLRQAGRRHRRAQGIAAGIHEVGSGAASTRLRTRWATSGCHVGHAESESYLPAPYRLQDKASSG